MGPFFPPRSPLQSMNLRAALVRALTHPKIKGMFTRPNIDRKTMLDECKGEGFEELLAEFSSNVVFKIMDELNMVTLAQKLAKASALSGVEQKSLLPLAIAHRASLNNILKKKERLRSTFSQFEKCLDGREGELLSKARTVKIMEEVDARGAEQHARAVAELTKQFDTHWEGDPKWKEIILEGNKIELPDTILDFPFPKGGRPIVDNTVDDVSTSHQPSLLEDLDKRVKAQEARLENWKSFRDEFNSSAPKGSSGPKSAEQSRTARDTGVSLDGHQIRMTHTNESRRGTFGEPSPRRGSVTERVDEYEKLTKLLEESFTDANQPRELSFGHRPGKPASLVIRGQDGNSVALKLPDNQLKGILGETSEEGLEVANPRARLHKDFSRVHDHGKSQSCTEGADMCLNGSETDPEAANVILPEKKSTLMEETSDILTQKLAWLAQGGPSSPPKYQPSLVERTRKSMALAKAEDGIGSSIAQSDDVPTSPIRVPDSLPSGSNLKSTGRETLVERTRQSMSLLPVKSRAPRTSLLKKPSKVYPTNPFETPKKSHPEMPGFSTPPEELFSQNAKYASVFKSRPKIALSPTQSPSFGCMGIVCESENGQFREDDVGEGMASSPLRNANERTGRS